MNDLSNVDILFLAAKCGIHPNDEPDQKGKFSLAQVRQQVQDDPACQVLAQQLRQRRTRDEESATKARAAAELERAEAESLLYRSHLDGSWSSHSKKFDIRLRHLTAGQLRKLAELTQSLVWRQA